MPRLKQVDHINNEKKLMAQIDHPFVVNMVHTLRGCFGALLPVGAPSPLWVPFMELSMGLSMGLTAEVLEVDLAWRWIWRSRW